MKVFLLFGAPGSGKGTQSQKVVDIWAERGHEGIYIGVGRLLREYVKEHTGHAYATLAEKMNEGHLIPSAFPILVTTTALMDLETEKELVIIDGGARRPHEADGLFEMLDGIFNAEVEVIVLDIPDEEVKKRLSMRGREDDMETSITKRLKDWHDKENGSAAALEYIKEKKLGTVHYVDGMGSIEEVFERIKKIVI